MAPSILNSKEKDNQIKIINRDFKDEKNTLFRICTRVDWLQYFVAEGRTPRDHNYL